jgi:hypothetical protein
LTASLQSKARNTIFAPPLRIRKRSTALYCATGAKFARHANALREADAGNGATPAANQAMGSVAIAGTDEPGGRADRWQRRGRPGSRFFLVSLRAPWRQ